MYTGRTPSHGWYSEPGSGEGKWKIKDNGPRGKVKNIVEAYGHIEKEHPELWERLVKERRVPAKGSTDDWSLQDFSEGIIHPSFKCKKKRGKRREFDRFHRHKR